MNQSETRPDEPAGHHVVVLGASANPARYSNQAICLLQEHGYRITPVNPVLQEIQGLAVTHDLADIEDVVNTLTLYVGEARSSLLQDKILAIHPERVIFNPGTKSQGLKWALEAQGVECVEGCTLVMLKTRQF